MSRGFVVPDDLEPVTRAADAPPAGTRLFHNRGCYGCGPDSPNGLHLDVLAGSAADAHVEITVATTHLGGPGVIHGGILASVFDESMGLAVPLAAGAIGVTVALSVDYSRPVPLGARVRFDVAVLGRAGRKVYTAGVARVVDDGGASESALGAEVSAARALFVLIDPRSHFRLDRT
ncbi:PaaI family thioesterase [Williamsia sp. CHRR-6]|uniref:PaaI family thioesterase n=1 Tax=Williamsia sp. CHRR-6 TaxID=2835871 RepID=UPI001BD927E0|nr:PaaI family thioesterase [Williamsia sp. CHRR-6]MBT0566104.1 PaaI family thioesterase [Williamsia sp. CHRR-6]